MWVVEGLGWRSLFPLRAVRSFTAAVIREWKARLEAGGGVSHLCWREIPVGSFLDLATKL
jgi:hypothetical protein